MYDVFRADYLRLDNQTGSLSLAKTTAIVCGSSSRRRTSYIFPIYVGQLVWSLCVLLKFHGCSLSRRHYPAEESWSSGSYNLTAPPPPPPPHPRSLSLDVGAASTGAVEKGRVFINVFQTQDW